LILPRGLRVPKPWILISHPNLSGEMRKYH
jgi:hypothetical protein